MRRYKVQPQFQNEDLLPYIILENGGNYFDRICFLNSNNFSHDKYSSFDWVIALGAKNELTTAGDGAFELLKHFSDNIDDWIFGFFNYDLKNQIERLLSSNEDNIQLPLLHFFQPVVLVVCEKGRISLGLLESEVRWRDHDKVWRIITGNYRFNKSLSANFSLRQRVSKQNYIANVNSIKNHIKKGDIYEMNYCIEFFNENVIINPLSIFEKLNNLSPAPFSSFYQLEDKYLMCSSPERFLKKTGEKIISQPIKGTIKRGDSEENDNQYREQLFYNSKERSENVMIVDLVRNDLSKTAEKGSVRVEELYGIYPFTNIYQMISTVTSHLKSDIHYIEAIKTAFPMGSMTGAPKIRAMEIIEDFEITRRGLYSGCVGYINPKKDFDFNVIIRSILYNKSTKYVSFMVGSAITDGSQPDKEYEECLLKAKAMIDVLENN